MKYILDTHTRNELNKTAAMHTPLLAITIGIVMAMYTVFNILGVTPDTNRIMIVHDLIIVVIAFAIFFASQRKIIKPSLTHPIVTALTLNISASVLHSLYLDPRPIFTILFMMYFLAIGSLFLSRKWALITILSSALGWYIIAYMVYDLALFIDYALAMMAVVLTSTMLIHNRINIQCKIIALHQKDEEAKNNLTESLAKTKAEIKERKKAEAEQSRLEDQLRQAQKLEAVGRLAGGVAHDINNMLAAISGTAEALRREIPKNPVTQTDIKSILEACNKGQKLTSNLLGFAQKGKYRREQIDVNQTIQDVHTFMARTIPPSIKFETILHEKLPKIEGDPGQINQVLVNLINNAVDAMDANGHLIITTENVDNIERQGVVGLETAKREYVKIIVSDTGHGMKEGTLERAFEPFFSTKKMGASTGLGLSMVYGTIANHGGSVLIRSAINQGTSVTIYLPEYTRNSLMPAKESGVYPASNPQLTTILLVDDEPLVRRSSSRILAQMGYSILEAGSGEEALQIYASANPPVNLVLLDLIMPEMDGDKVFQKLKSENPDVKVIFVSAFSKDTTRVDNLLADGALDFVQKPFTTKQISKVISNAIVPLPK